MILMGALGYMEFWGVLKSVATAKRIWSIYDIWWLPCIEVTFLVIALLLGGMSLS